MDITVNKIEQLQIKNNDILNFKAGDTVCVNFKIVYDKNKARTQNFEGLVIAIRKNGLNTTCTIRKLSFGEDVEKVFFIHSPVINWIKIKKRGLVRQSKIFYIRKLKGNAAKIKEKIIKRRDARVA